MVGKVHILGAVISFPLSPTVGFTGRNVMQTTVDSKKSEEINRHIAFIERVVALWIKLTPDDNIMGRVFLDVKDKLERIKYLNNQGV